MKKLLIAALLGGCLTVPANAVVSIGLAPSLTFEHRSPGPGDTLETDIIDYYTDTITFTGESWTSLFDMSKAGILYSCAECITARISANKLSFDAEDFQGYGDLGVSLLFDRNIEDDYSAIIPENFVSGYLRWSSAHHSGLSELFGPVLYLAFSEPGSGPPRAPVDPVPEPATWALMIGGFALAGAAMRRRKVAVAFT